MSDEMDSKGAQFWAAPVAGEQGDTGRKPTARARSRDDETRRVDTQLVGMLRGPQQSGVTVLNGYGSGYSGARRYSTLTITAPWLAT